MPFVGCVVSGVILSGTVKTGDPVLLGPDSLGAFIPTSVRSIERKRVRVAGAEAGQSVALALKRIRRNQVRKGMVLLGSEATPKAVSRFTASVLILYHNSTIAKGYQAMAHIGSIRQTVRIVDIDKPFVRTGDRASVVFEFIKSPEFCRPGSRILFREGKTKVSLNIHSTRLSRLLECWRSYRRSLMTLLPPGSRSDHFPVWRYSCETCGCSAWRLTALQWIPCIFSPWSCWKASPCM